MTTTSPQKNSARSRLCTSVGTRRRMNADFETLHPRELRIPPLTNRHRRAQVLLRILRSWRAAEGVGTTNLGLYRVAAHGGVQDAAEKIRHRLTLVCRTESEPTTAVETTHRCKQEGRRRHTHLRPIGPVLERRTMGICAGPNEPTVFAGASTHLASATRPKNMYLKTDRPACVS